MVQVLLKVVDGTTVDDAVNIMQEAHMNGLAMVTQCSQVCAGTLCVQCSWWREGLGCLHAAQLASGSAGSCAGQGHAMSTAVRACTLARHGASVLWRPAPALSWWATMRWLGCSGLPSRPPGHQVAPEKNLASPLTPSLQDKAEQYCENLRLNGLISTIEPAGGGGSSGGPEAS